MSRLGEWGRALWHWYLDRYHLVGWSDTTIVLMGTPAQIARYQQRLYWHRSYTEVTDGQ